MIGAIMKVVYKNRINIALSVQQTVNFDLLVGFLTCFLCKLMPFSRKNCVIKGDLPVS